MKPIINMQILVAVNMHLSFVSCICQPWCSSRKKTNNKKKKKTHGWVPAECEFLMTLRCHSRPWLCSALACLSVRGREDFQDCRESQVKKVNLERVTLAPLWVWVSIDLPVSSIYYLVQPVMRNLESGYQNVADGIEYEVRLWLKTLSG